MPQAGFEPGSLSERLLEFDTRSKLLGHHGRSLRCLFECNKLKLRNRICHLHFKSYICNCRSFILDNLDMKVTIIEKVMPNTVNHRLESEEWDIKTLNT